MNDVVARTIWGEARGEGDAGMHAVASVIWLRALREAEQYGVELKDALEIVCLEKAQFSCWGADEKFLQEVPYPCWQWELCGKIAAEMAEGKFEATIVADHYCAMRCYPDWADHMRFVGVVGEQRFYLEDDRIPGAKE